MSETETSTEVQVVDNEDLDTFSKDFFGQKPEENEPPKTKGDVEQEPEPTTDDKSGDAQDPDPNDDPDAEYKEEPPKKKTVQDRIDELVRQREDVKRDADAKIEALRKEFEDQLKALKPQPKVDNTSEPGPEDVKEDGTPKYPLGEFDPTYIKDLTRFTLEAERTKAQVEAQQQQREAEAQRAQVELQTSWNTRLEAAKTEYPDLVEKGQELLSGFNDLPQDYAGYLSTVLMSMDKGPDVFYYLSNHPDEARQIVNSGAQKATLALGRIEAKFLQADAEKTLVKPKVSKAPEPPQVRARGTNGAFIETPPDTDDLDAFSDQFFRKK